MDSKAKFQQSTGAEQVPMTLQRREQIMNLIQEQQSVRVAELAVRFQVSTVTIRNDLTALGRDGRLIRDRGGAIVGKSRRKITSLLAVEERAHLHTLEKERIAKAAAALVQPGDTIIMDAGTTVVRMAAYLSNISPLTVVTNALNVALEMGANTTAEIILLGGNFERTSSSALGAAVEKTLAELTVDKLFLGAQALEAENGITDTTMEIAHIKRAMIKAARQVILCFDSAKWASSGFIKVAPLSVAQKIITDSKLPAAAQTAIREQGIELMMV